MGGPCDSGRNVKYWDQALTAARRHGDLYLEALTTKNMGIVAMMEYGYAATIVEVQARSCATSTNCNTDCCQCMLCAA